MRESTRQFYGAIALLLVFLAGFAGGVIWGRPNGAVAFIATWLIVAAVVFGWAATRKV